MFRWHDIKNESICDLMEKVWVKKELYKWRYKFLNFLEFSGFYFDFKELFGAIYLLKISIKGYIFTHDLRSWRGAAQTRGGATRAHVDACVAPTWCE